MIIIAAICLTVFHPGLAFKSYLAESDWSLRRTKETESSSHVKLDSLDMASGIHGTGISQ